MTRRRRPGQLSLTWADGGLELPKNFTWLAPDRPALQCQTCGRLLPDLCFNPKGRTGNGTISRRADCVACEQRRRDEYKAAHRFEIRARNVLTSHMRRERKAGLHAARTLDEYTILAGLSVEQLASEMAAVWEHGRCPGICGVAWRDMPNGLSDMTIHRPDRDRMLSPTNYVILCRTENVGTGTRDARAQQVRDGYYRCLMGEAQ